jgi:hypothetical protein
MNEGKEKIAVTIGFVAVIGLVVLFSSVTTGKYAPRFPRDTFHKSVISDAGCRTCHIPGRQAPLRETHPPVTECLSCHRPGVAR